MTLLSNLHTLSDRSVVEGMERFGVEAKNALGISVPKLRELAKQYRKDHALALELWDSGIHEARILASMIDDPSLVTEKQCDTWVAGFYSWDLCDQVCGNLLDRTPFATKKAIEYSQREEEFVKRAGFVLMATMAVHNKKMPDADLLTFFPFIEQAASDDRNFVKKAVNWALRQIGKRSIFLHGNAIDTALRISTLESRSAKWIASDALRELRSGKIRVKLK